MSAVAAAAAPWLPTEKLNEAIALLVQLQTAPKRDMDREQIIAKEAGEYAHQRDNHDFMIYVKVEAERAFWSRYLPKAQLERREDWQQCAIGLCGSVEAGWRLERRPGPVLVESYFNSFELGVALGYPEEMGDKWYIHMADSSGTFYIPIDAAASVIGTSL